MKATTIVVRGTVSCLVVIGIWAVSIDAPAEGRPMGGGVPAAPWKTKGNSNVNPNINFLGTTDAHDLVFRTNDIERMQIWSTGEIEMLSDLILQSDLVLMNGSLGIGAVPEAPLHVEALGSYKGNHIALFRSVGSSSADGIAIELDNEHTNADNNFLTFYNGAGEAVGRVEGFDLENGDWIDPPPLPTIGMGLDPDIFNPNFVVYDWDNGSLPSLSIDFGELDFDFDSGSLPSLDIDIKSPIDFNVNPFDFDLPTIDEIEDLMCWSLENDVGDFLTLDPVGLATAALKVAAAQVCKDEGVTYGSRGADYAEWLAKLDPNEHLQFGQIVGIFGGKVSLKTDGADHIMAVSANPVVVGNTPPEADEDQYIKVSFMGQVPVVVHGQVAIGDYIIPSGQEDGTAVAVSPDAIELEHLPKILGRAWSESQNNVYSLINVVIGVRSNEMTGILAGYDQRMRSLEARLDSYTKKTDAIAMLSERLESAEAQLREIAATQE